MRTARSEWYNDDHIWIISKASYTTIRQFPADEMAHAYSYYCMLKFILSPALNHSKKYIENSITTGYEGVIRVSEPEEFYRAHDYRDS